MTVADDEPPRAFDDSRRLPGPNRWLDRPGVVLTPMGAAATEAEVIAAWALRVQALCQALGWPHPQPVAAREALAFAAPEDRLFTATEVNEWAWERSAAAHAPLAEQGFEPAQPVAEEVPAVALHFAALAAREISPPAARLRAAAARHGLPVFEDDDSLSVGAGTGSRCWPRAALPLPMDVPWAALHDVPTLLVTGSNGKTTTARLLAAMAARGGLVAGLCSTEGVVIGGLTVLRGDYAGPAGARAVLRQRDVQCAVLETARGGLLRRGLAVRRADAAVITNVSADHLGEYGIASVEDIAEVKLVVAHAVAAGGTLVLNGGDAVLMAVAARTPAVQALRAAGRVSLFALDDGHAELAAWRAAGGRTCGVREGRLVLCSGAQHDDLGEIAAMPLTLHGAAHHNVENLAAAVLAARAAGLPDAAVRGTLLHFGARPQDNPGRLERWAHRGATVLVDYAHNPDGLAQLLRVARALAGSNRLGLLLGQAGNRDDAAIAELARTAAAARPDLVVVKELPQMLRGRAPGDVPALLCAALHTSGQPAAAVQRVADEFDAAQSLLAWARPGDVLVLPVHTTAVRERLAALLVA